MGLPNEIWVEEDCNHPQYILYTEDFKLARTICAWNAFKDGRIRVMGDYYPTVDSSRPHAIQFRFTSALKHRVARAAGLSVR